MTQPSGPRPKRFRSAQPRAPRGAGSDARHAVPTLAAGLVVGLVTVVKTLALAGLIYRGPLAPGLPVGVSAVLAGAAVSALLSAWLSGSSLLVAGPLTPPAVAYALIPAALFPDAFAGGAGGLRDPVAAAQLVLVVSGLTSLLAGLGLWLLGALRLGSLARFLPYPVLAGYNAGTGWLFMIGGVALGADVRLGGFGWEHLATPPALARLVACAGMGVALLAAERRWHHWAIMPGAFLLAIAGFHAGRVAAGIDLAQASRAGWLLGPFAPGRLWTAPDWNVVAALGPTRLLAVGPIALAVVLVGVTSAIMMISGLEVELHRRLDTDEELRASGIATAAAGVFGGLVASPSMAATTLSYGMGGRSRMVGVLVGLCCAAALLSGTGVLNAIPRFAIGALLVSNGLDRLLDRAWLTRRSLPRMEWAAVLLVLFVIIWAGFLSGVGMGLGLTLVIFVWNYRRVPVVRLSAAGAAHRSSVMRPLAEDAVLRRDGSAIRLLRLQGYLFFLNSAALIEALPEAGVRFLVVDFRAVAGMDSSAGMSLRRVYQIARERGYAVLCTGLDPALRAQFARLRLPLAAPPDLPAASTEDAALQYAEARLLEAAGLSAVAGPASLAALFGETLGRPVPSAHLAPYLERQTLAGGAVLIRQGAPSDTMAFIVAGRVAVRLETAHGVPVQLATAGPGVVMGEVGFYTGVPRTATVVAETDTQVETLSQAALARMERDDPALASLLHRLMTCMLADKLAGSTRQQAQSGT